MNLVFWDVVKIIVYVYFFTFLLVPLVWVVFYTISNGISAGMVDGNKKVILSRKNVEEV